MRPKVKVKVYEMRFVIVLSLSLSHSALCGHSRSLLMQGDQAVLAPPEANFDEELRRIKLSPPEFHATGTTPPYRTDDTKIPELNDLREALQKAGRSAEET